MKAARLPPPLRAQLLQAPRSCPPPHSLLHQQRRTFFPNPLSSTTPTQNLTASRTLPYPASAIYSIIADVPKYSTFLPYCQESSITRWSSPDSSGKRWPSEAKLVVGWSNITETFHSRIYCVPERIVEAVGGNTATSLKGDEIAHHDISDPSPNTARESENSPLLTHLLTRWTISPFPYKPAPTQDGAQPRPQDKTNAPAKEQTQVSLSIEYQFASPVYSAMSAAVAPKVAGHLIEAFEKRVRALLGEADTGGPGMGGTQDVPGTREGVIKDGQEP